MKDSGERDIYEGGAQRDKQEGRGRYDLISPIALERLALVYEEGAKGKGERNWEDGVPLSRYINSALRHIQQYLRGMRDEDHITQAAWNLFGLIHTEDQCNYGNLPQGLCDLPNYEVMGQGEYNIPPEVTPEVTPQVVPWEGDKKVSLRDYPVRSISEGDEFDLITGERK